MLASYTMNRQHAGRPLHQVAKDVVSSHHIDWIAVQQFWSDHKEDAGLDVIAALLHGTYSTKVTSAPLWSKRVTEFLSTNNVIAILDHVLNSVACTLFALILSLRRHGILLASLFDQSDICPLMHSPLAIRCHRNLASYVEFISMHIITQPRLRRHTFLFHGTYSIKVPFTSAPQVLLPNISITMLSRVVC
jgi:hypothetical protein